MRVAALYDIHANLPALEAVMQEVRQARVDQIVVGGDIFPGLMPRETLTYLLNLDIPVQFIRGNCEEDVLALMRGGTSTVPERFLEGFRWVTQQLDPEYEPLIASWPLTLQIEIAGVGEVLFCHATPRNVNEIFTQLTAEDLLLPVFEAVNAAVVVCGHTHMQFDRMVGETRVVNAGSVGAPFGEPGAYWLLLDADVQLRRTDYDLNKAVERLRATSHPHAQEEAERILHPSSEQEMVELYSKWELRQ